MRVNIGYSCDLEDVQEEIVSFLERISLKLSDSSIVMGNVAKTLAGQNYNPEQVLLDIHKTRLLLNKLDIRLEDTTTIIVGLENAKAKIAAGESLEVQEEEAEPAPENVSRVKGPPEIAPPEVLKPKKVRSRKKKGKR